MIDRYVVVGNYDDTGGLERYDNGGCVLYNDHLSDVSSYKELLSIASLKISEKDKEIARLREALELMEFKYRYKQWMSHNSKHILYGDDGEMQCNSCGLDFKRDSLAHIEAKILADNIEIARESLGVDNE